jgi:hypothetical protein
MSPKPFPNASPKIEIKRKKSPVWLFATRGVLEQALTGLIDKGKVLELSPPNEWRIHPSTKTRGSGFQHERYVWGINDGDEWAIVKICQHASDPSKTAGRTGFKGSDVADLNTDLIAKLLRSAVRGDGPPRPSRNQPPSPKTQGRRSDLRNIHR